MAATAVHATRETTGHVRWVSRELTGFDELLQRVWSRPAVREAYGGVKQHVLAHGAAYARMLERAIMKAIAHLMRLVDYSHDRRIHGIGLA